MINMNTVIPNSLVPYLMQNSNKCNTYFYKVWPNVTIPLRNNHVDLCVHAMCHTVYTTAHGVHISILKVLPHRIILIKRNYSFIFCICVSYHFSTQKCVCKVGHEKSDTNVYILKLYVEYLEVVQVKSETMSPFLRNGPEY